MRTKVILILSFLILTSVESISKCAEKALLVWPFTSELSANPQFMVTAALGMQDFVIDSLEKYPIILVSEKDTVEIKLGQAFVNEFNQTQYFATVERPMIVGNYYRIEIFTDDPRPEYYQQQFFINIHPWDHKWLIVDNVESSNPTFLATPQKVSGTYYTPGCGLESFDNYSIETNNNDFNLVEVKVKRGDYELTTFSHIDNSTINVGFGMCIGQYLFKEAEEYDVSFTLVNINGQRSETKHLRKMVSPKWDVETEPKIYMK